jgi:hypothetical protein
MRPRPGPLSASHTLLKNERTVVVRSVKERAARRRYLNVIRDQPYNRLRWRTTPSAMRATIRSARDAGSGTAKATGGMIVTSGLII